MITKKITLSESELQQYRQIDDSIIHWSVKHTDMVLASKRLLGAVESMYEGRLQLINNVMKAEGINPVHVHGAHINKEDGTVSIQYDETAVNPTVGAEESNT